MVRDSSTSSIQERAYALSKEKPENSDFENWIQAEHELRNTARPHKTYTSLIILCVAAAIFITVSAGIRQWLVQDDTYRQYPLFADIWYYTIVWIIAVLAIALYSKVPWTRHSWRHVSEKILGLGDERSAWDWIKLLGAPSLFAMTAGVLSYAFNNSNQGLSRILAGAKEREAIMNAYIQDMSSIVEKKRWIYLNQDQRIAIATRTHNTLEALENDSLRQGIVFRFASRVFPDYTCLESVYSVNEPPHRPIKEAEDINCYWPTNISLKNIYLDGLRIDDTNSIYRGVLKGANLTGAKLSNSNLSKADLGKTNLTRSKLNESVFSPVTNLMAADFDSADINGSKFDGTRLDKVRNFSRASYTYISFTRHPAYLDKKAFPSQFREGRPNKPAYLCQLIEQGRVLFLPDNPITSDNMSPYSAKLEPMKFKDPQDSGKQKNPVEPMRKQELETKSEYDKNFDSKFNKNFGCLPDPPKPQPYISMVGARR
ncbi:pentapeptide repeat-containing protein [Synechococcus sp. J7-Johnson]|uniref:pentapeptide repeat-containing protein n=1 Tax=Synechococcus sp. J7-Johnson TaxID=2823737 RepID=UPI0020CE8042|nr:pentapeptide repeat-containing protein [Synechococcus sp. J7-Johnson]MCP9841656.1 pentapeptide repeat-containing protein [Synechococcus sp. J7-Johnson]